MYEALNSVPNTTTTSTTATTTTIINNNNNNVESDRTYLILMLTFVLQM